MIWSVFGLALVPPALVWSGVGWQTTLGTTALVAVVGGVCALLLRWTGLHLTPPERRNDDAPPAP